MRPKRRNDTRVLYIDRERKKEEENRKNKKIMMWKRRQELCTMALYNNLIRDVAQLGSAFVLGTKCHRFKSCHPYLLLLSSL